MRQTIPELKNKLEELYLEYNRPDFIPKDPVKFPHRYKKKSDREIAAFIAATIAWGRRDLILRSGERIFETLGPSPYSYVMEEKFLSLDDRGKSLHRTFFEGDLKYFCRGLRACYTKYDSLEALFTQSDNIFDGISLFRRTMAEGNGGLYSKHVANPDSGSACKRLNLALRWLIRREGPVDLGLWKSISPASLIIPLDVHVGRISRKLGLLQRKANDRKSALFLTDSLRAFCPEDPCKYDLALFGYGVGEEKY